MQYNNCTEQVAIVAKMLHYVNSTKLICMNSNKIILKHKLDSITGDRLGRLYDAPPQLYYRGTDPSDLLTRPSVAIVGSRKMSTYGRAVTEKLATDLANAGIVIVSGLALGVDSAAHRMAVQANVPTIAVLAGGLDTIHPTSHFGLAQRILERGGTLVSEYPEGMPPLAHQFVARNRIIAALADAVLITEAALGSGSLHTAAFALDLGKPVLAVPGPINSSLSAGTNQLIKTGATVVTGIDDILAVLNITKQAAQQNLFGSNDAESALLTAIGQGITDGLALQRTTGLKVTDFAQTLTMLEINGKIRSLGGDTWALA